MLLGVLLLLDRLGILVHGLLEAEPIYEATAGGPLASQNDSGHVGHELG
jgi:hypothetical protein